MTTWQHIAGKLASGRWLLTLAVGVAFVAFSLTVCAVVALNWYRLTAGEIVGMFGALMLVVQAVTKDYFSRKDRADNPPPNPEG